MKKIQNIALLIIVLTAFACSKNEVPTVEDHFLNYDIPLVPVESDYTVGAIYDRFEWSSNIEETPTVGLYESEMGDPITYAKHVEQAKLGGIDYFIMGLRSSTNQSEFDTDKAFINTLHQASNSTEMNFAIAYNFGAMGLKESKTIEDAALVPVFLKDFELMLTFFQQPNYMKIDGKSVVYITNGFELYSNDNTALYNQLRTQMNGMGVELYIIGEQTDWTPPLRYAIRFIDCVDAVTHRTYLDISLTDNDRYILLNKYCDQAWMYHQEQFNLYGIEYVPTVATSINPKIQNSSSTNYIFEKDPQFFAEHCNVGRRAAGSKKLIILDSFNDWNKGSQIESATSYGEEFLNILKSQFKVD